MTGAAHTIIRIKGQNDGDDIRLQMTGTVLGLSVRTTGDELFGVLKGKDAANNIIDFNVFCRKGTWTGPSVNVATVSAPVVPTAWKAGEWHHIAFAWYEWLPFNPQDDDNNAATDARSDGPAGTPKYDDLDDNQVIAPMKLWVDGQPVAFAGRVQAFNLIPDASNAQLWIGEPGAAPAGTVDGLVAYTHNDPNLNMSVTKPTARYWGYPLKTYAVYTSPTITLPTAVTSRAVCLGTLSYTLLPPLFPAGTTWAFGWTDYPAYATVTLGGQTSAPIPDSGASVPYFWQEQLGGGAPLRLNTVVPPHAGPVIQSAGAPTISYHLYLNAYRGDATQGEPPYYQTPIIEDVTITYLGPVVFFHWR
jgi:hypothetical protein